jgi:T5SS/PEP-CTERM-associated repeat protein
MKSVTHKPRHFPTKSLLALSLLMAYGSGFAGTTITTVPVGTVVSVSSDALLGRAAADVDTLNVVGAGTQWKNLDGYVWSSYWNQPIFVNVTNAVGYSGSGTLNIANGGVVTTTRSTVGSVTGSSGTVKVTGAGSQWNNAQELTVGNAGTGILNIENGGVVNSVNTNNFFSPNFVGLNSGSNGTVKVTGTGSQWNVGQTLYVGNSGTGTLNILDAGRVTAPQLSIGTKGSVNLSGGALQVGSGSIASGGAFNWTNGTLSYTGNASVGSGLLTSTTTLGAGKTLNVANNLTVGTGSTLQTNGGTLSAGTLTLDGGTLQTSSTTTTGGIFSWLKGTLGFTDDASLGSGLLATTATLGTGKALNVANNLIIGNANPNQAHILNIENGGVVSNSTGLVGYNQGNGAVRVTGIGSQWNNTSNLFVGYQGSGSLKIENGGVVRNNNYGEVGFLGGSNATATVTGTGSQWNSSSFLTVGYQGNGTLNIENGGVVSSVGGFMGYATGSRSDVKVTGAGSQWLNSGSLLVGVDGTGTLNLLDSGKVTALELSIGTKGSVNLNGGALQVGNGSIASGGVFNWSSGALAFAGNASVGSGLLASTTTLGTGKTLNIANGLTVGNSSQSANILNIENGGVASSSSGYVGNTTGSSGTVNVTGAGSKWSNAGYIYVGQSGRGTLNVENGGVVSSAYSMVGGNPGSNGVVKVTGAGSQWNNSGDLYFGTWGSGTLNIENGGVVSSAATYVGDNTSGIGSVNVTGSGSQLNNSRLLYVGYLGTGTLNVLDSAKVTTNALNIGSKGTLNLDGGTLQVGSGSIASGGVFNWASGTLGFTGNATVGSGLLASTTALGTGKTLNVASNLTIGSGKTIALAGGQFSANTLTLNGGSITSTGAVDLTNTGTLTGYGTVAGNVTGGATNTITASGGALTLGNANANGGYAFGGTLNVGSQQVALLSADKAQLGTTTNLGAGGTLSTVNGANLASGNTVSFNGDSTIQGNFTNNGNVAGSAGTLNFANNVNGAGSYAGNIAFQAAFNPGNSPASVSFGGGNATFASTSVLTMELLGSTPGTQYDQLVGINSLSFNGKLNLVFAEGYVPLTGSSFALFGFNSFNGSFGTAENGYASITVAGYDRAKLDFSHLATDGTLRLATVTAVPEPESYAMFLAGLALMGVMARRRKAVAV